ncbi:DUF2339 domain-containing protein [Aquimarina sp. TRL1]|uniref:DUF2339 domain-containing protein n=1 Tax=Aquimarina sp. (strain TRL1) TaxID=2736252 RepID=UPI00158F136A|nr:DUF2339 domain-containing protein [Aquimarina sp. TRL1]QKX03452.1 DUF2339 domain-containing protein [Aquimarina sp. TRL1]
MNTNQEKIAILSEKMNALIKKHQVFTKEIIQLRDELKELKSAVQKEPKSTHTTQSIRTTPVKTETPPKKQIQQQPATPHTIRKTPRVKKKSNLEKFIGENLISKIGILITIIGVGIGAKYSIENNLINPITRIILGYLAGAGLLFFGIKLKKKYKNYSAVLVSGAIAVLYFITYAAYDLYQLFPQILAFILMLIFTAFAVITAIQYNKQLIAHIGLVGAYAVPFLLSDGSGKVEILFSYMAIVNIGILIISFKKYWKPLYYVSFGFTWLIYLSWHISEFSVEKNFSIALIFALLFFVIFYTTFLGYKLLQKEAYKNRDAILPFLNSFIFYGVGYAILVDHPTGKHLLGLFTLGNAVLHFIPGVIIHRLKLGNKSLLYFVLGLVLVFITIAIPVQLDGNWVTLLWITEAALLFWIGRTKQISFYEILSYILMLIGFFSLLHDWGNFYGHYSLHAPEKKITPILNSCFLTAIICMAGYGFISFLDQYKNDTSPLKKGSLIPKIASFLIPAILIIICYNSFLLEINAYWDQLYQDSHIHKGDLYKTNETLILFKNIWSILYSLIFISLLSLLNTYIIKNKYLSIVNTLFNGLCIFLFLTIGLYTISELRESYLNKEISEYYTISYFTILIRYIALVILGGAIYALYKQTQHLISEFNIGFLRPLTELFIHFVIIWVASSELIHWLDMSSAEQSYKLGLSILWGIYSLFLITLGIWKKKKHLRIGAIVLFGITLIKLFLYDISHLGTIAKTIVFVSLGILLLIISFLYNKYKHIISEENED